MYTSATAGGTLLDILVDIQFFIGFFIKKISISIYRNILTFNFTFSGLYTHICGRPCVYVYIQQIDTCVSIGVSRQFSQIVGTLFIFYQKIFQKKKITYYDVQGYLYFIITFETLKFSQLLLFIFYGFKHPLHAVTVPSS